MLLQHSTSVRVRVSILIDIRAMDDEWESVMSRPKLGTWFGKGAFDCLLSHRFTSQSYHQKGEAVISCAWTMVPICMYILPIKEDVEEDSTKTVIHFTLVLHRYKQMDAFKELKRHSLIHGTHVVTYSYLWGLLQKDSQRGPIDFPLKS